MPSVRLSPLFNGQTVTSAGAPASGYRLWTYAAGSSSQLATYTDSTGTVPQANPVTLDANGFPENPIWLQTGLAYKLVLKDANDVVIDTWDNISGVNDTGSSVSQWQASGATPTYVSASTFTLVGDQTTEFHVGRKLQFTVTAGTVYGVITASAYTTLTTVTVALVSSALDSGLSAVNLSILRADIQALPVINYNKSQTIASAATVDIGGAASNNITVSGTTTITSLGTAAEGIQRDVTFSGALTLTYNATSLILPGASNITTAAGDCATFLSLGSGNWRCTKYWPASGVASKVSPSFTGATVSYSDVTPDFRVNATSGGAATLSLISAGNFTWKYQGLSLSTRITKDATTLVEWDVSGNYYGGADNAQTNGAAARRWSVVYAGTGAINTSDAREKTTVRSLTDAEIKAASQLSKEIGAFRFLDAMRTKGEAAREHIGMTVQRAIDILEAHGLDPFSYGFICYDTWPERGEVLDDEGNVVEPAQKAGDRYSFRTDELLLFIARGFEARLALLEMGK